MTGNVVNQNKKVNVQPFLSRFAKRLPVKDGTSESNTYRSATIVTEVRRETTDDK